MKIKALGNPNIFARVLLTRLFTVAEIQGKSVTGKKSNAFKNAEAKGKLDEFRFQKILSKCNLYKINLALCCTVCSKFRWPASPKLAAVHSNTHGINIKLKFPYSTYCVLAPFALNEQWIQSIASVFIKQFL